MRWPRPRGSITSACRYAQCARQGRSAVYDRGFVLQASRLGARSAAAQGLSIIIDLHHYEELMKKPAQHADRLVGIWKQVAERYKSRPASVAFELINEPSNELKSVLLNPIQQRAIAAIRSTNPTRLIIANSYFWGRRGLPERARAAARSQRDRVISRLSTDLVHAPAHALHASGVPNQWRGVPCPPAAPVTPVEAGQKTDWVSTWFDSYNSQPIATNANGTQCHLRLLQDRRSVHQEQQAQGVHGRVRRSDNADPKSREAWLRMVRQEAEKRKIGWAVWDDGGKFRALNVTLGTWVAPVHAGLFE
ncbi:MAG: cellulase family glycosylhydrolase [Pseudomonadota bacterium]